MGGGAKILFGVFVNTKNAISMKQEKQKKTYENKNLVRQGHILNGFVSVPIECV